MSEPYEEVVDVGGTSLAVRVHPADVVAEGGHARAGAVLVHGLASNARMWDACAVALAAAGVTSVAPDLRGHGRSTGLTETRDGATGLAADQGSAPDRPYGTSPAAADVEAVVAHFQLDGTVPPPVVLAGQSWGGNVVLTVAAEHAGQVDALALVDGGWLRFDGDEPFEQLWQRLRPPVWGDVTREQVEERIGSAVAAWGPHALPAVMANLTTDEHGHVRNVLDVAVHEQILRSVHAADPRSLYPHVGVPVLLAPAGGPASALVEEALEGIPDARLRRYEGAHHDLHLQHPERLARDLLDLVDEISLATLPSEGTS
ncbi:alpha/beta fold hydrolase [Aquipuribacter hungaricus]|uniref:Alpha/beta fold hydrolase n=1 Tax=Aquipuribacter hungaricus TaxID=545624 RepID=A0ABV7WLB1_9MICO